jgi:hypothetical protein
VRHEPNVRRAIVVQHARGIDRATRTHTAGKKTRPAVATAGAPPGTENANVRASQSRDPVHLIVEAGTSDTDCRQARSEHQSIDNARALALHSGETFD